MKPSVLSATPYFGASGVKIWLADTEEKNSPSFSPECSLQQAGVRAEEIRTRLKGLHTERASEIPGVITVSIGVAALAETTDKDNLLLKFADDALSKMNERPLAT
jgi:GGDEF domain-containing protein